MICLAPGIEIASPDARTCRGKVAEYKPVRGRTALPREISIEPVDFSFGNRFGDAIESVLEDLDLSQKVGDVVVRVYQAAEKLASVTIGLKDGILPFVELAMTRACFEEAPEFHEFSETNLKQILYHEMMHVSDRLDPEFGSGFDQMSNIRSNELWNIWIDGRLDRRGVSVDKALRKEQYQALFGESNEAEKWFDWLWKKDVTVTFRELQLLSFELPWAV